MTGWHIIDVLKCFVIICYKLRRKASGVRSQHPPLDGVVLEGRLTFAGVLHSSTQFQLKDIDYADVTI